MGEGVESHCLDVGRVSHLHDIHEITFHGNYGRWSAVKQGKNDLVDAGGACLPVKARQVERWHAAKTVMYLRKKRDEYKGFKIQEIKEIKTLKRIVKTFGLS